MEIRDIDCFETFTITVVVGGNVVLHGGSLRPRIYIRHVARLNKKGFDIIQDAVAYFPQLLHVHTELLCSALPLPLQSFKHSSTPSTKRFHKKGAPKDERKQVFRSPVVNVAQMACNDNSMNRGAARYTSREKLFMLHFIFADDVWVARCKAALNYWLGFLASMLVSNDDNKLYS